MKAHERYRIGLELLGPVQGQRILDAGCGFGTLQQYIEAIGIDAHFKNLRKTRLEKGIDNLIHAKLEQIPFCDDCFDAVISLETLEHVDDEEKVLSEIARVLKMGGRLILSVPHHRLLYNFIDLEHWLIPLLTKRAVHRHYKKKGLSQKLSESGFKIDCCMERGMLITAFMRWFYLPFDLIDYFLFGSMNGPFGKRIRKIFDRLVDFEFSIPTRFGGSLFIAAHKEKNLCASL